MSNRTEAAAEALEEHVELSDGVGCCCAAFALAAADATDTENGIVRVSMSNEAIERAAKIMNGWMSTPWEDQPKWAKNEAIDRARAVIDALRADGCITRRLP